MFDSGFPIRSVFFGSQTFELRVWGFEVAYVKRVRTLRFKGPAAVIERQSDPL